MVPISCPLVKSQCLGYFVKTPAFYPPPHVVLSRSSQPRRRGNESKTKALGASASVAATSLTALDVGQSVGSRRLAEVGVS